MMDARFAVARRHSRRVRTLRVAVPVAVVAVLGGIVLVSVFNPFRLLTKLPIDVGNLVVSGTRVTMQSPHLSGFTPDQRPYEVWAKAATQDLTDPAHVDLSDLRARMVTEDKTSVVIDSRKGLFDTKGQLLNLTQDVLVQTSSGYDMTLQDAFLDIAKGSVSSDNPVLLKMPNGSIHGQRLRITERGAVVRFDGGVKMNLDGSAVNPPAPQASSVPASNNADSAEPPRKRNAPAGGTK
jgi:lipopolysaccharide export system protein LptC